MTSTLKYIAEETGNGTLVPVHKGERIATFCTCRILDLNLINLI